MPPLNGFVSELLIYLGLLRTVAPGAPAPGVAFALPVLALIGALALACFVKVFGAVFLGHPRGMQAVPKLSADFLTNFDRFNLNAQEGYLVSLIDGRLSVQKLIILSPFDPFTTIFILAKLQQEKAIMVP